MTWDEIITQYNATPHGEGYDDFSHLYLNPPAHLWRIWFNHKDELPWPRLHLMFTAEDQMTEHAYVYTSLLPALPWKEVGRDKGPS